MQPDRHIPLQGASNFRDFGGYSARDGRTVKWRRLFRSDRLSELTDGDYQVLGEHGIRYVYDLRRDIETKTSPTAWQGDPRPEIIHSPLFNGDDGLATISRVAADPAARHDPDRTRVIMVEMYTRMVTQPGPLDAFRRIFLRLAEPAAFPTLFHCTGGKDRTGVTCALILGVLGVSEDDILDDFMLTQKYYASAENLKRRVSQMIATSEMGSWSEEALAPIFGVERAYLETALACVADAGGVEAFLTNKVGAPAEALEQLRDALLD